MSVTREKLEICLAVPEDDFSAEVCPGAGLEDLDPEAIERFRSMWCENSGNQALAPLSADRLLADAELLAGGKVTYAALILLGTRKALGRYLAQAEVIFEYRSREGTISHQQRDEYRHGFLLFHDDLWQTINLRNDLFSYLYRFVRREVRTFNEDAVREAILNAVSHRDYRLPGSIFVRQWPTRVEIVSPGGFPSGITSENFRWRQHPRNRRIAETFARCGLVERAGQGADRIFEACVREGKLPPDLAGSDEYQVALVLDGQVRDPEFLRFLDRVEEETHSRPDADDLMVIDAVHRQVPVPEPGRHRLNALCERGILERADPGVILGKRFYRPTGANNVRQPAPGDRSPFLTNSGFAPGTVLADRYRIIRLLAHGGMGKIYHAEDLKLDQPVALKFMAEPFTRQLLSEAEITRRISHPNVRRTHDLHEIDGLPFLSMEYVEGVPLDSLLRQAGRLSHDKALDLARQLCQGLAAAHDQGIVHGDLKPAHLIIDGNGTMKLSGFGSVGLMPTISDAAAVPYLTPEHLAGKDLTETSDVYALGLVVYEMVTGQQAFATDSREELVRRQRELPPRFPSERIAVIDPELAGIILRCLEPDPGQRPASVREVENVLRRSARPQD